ncbi:MULTISPECIES: NUDIX domain-containing protein [unclassified Enterococcus]|uniref:NUDIX domain-containing protein n=1 Tax=unclassified Enterococcus TaxID=2608891 RepID=UPI00190566AA|nr:MULTISPECIES: NUDIX domain-containing protein [unclassified Enterococcus]MBK0039171.1 NUDIX domain-containing protein [Enterococcus sp. S52]MBK0071736.1 NUDIX domain-containing protein [Enterococcus sp. S53]MBK0142320.1 NUDIX domain-containing protein [Enterococcus sp. S76]MBK0145735.1 NUDIX domain-containing protein [Enterococcus sp. S77]
MKTDQKGSGIILVSMIEREILTVLHPEGHIGFPKGEIETTDISEEAAALRELYEETGLTPNFLLDTDKYFFTEKYKAHENQKQIKYFIGIICNPYLLKNSGTLAAAWSSINELKQNRLFLSQDVLKFIEPLIKKEIFFLANSGKRNTYSLGNNQTYSKHAYSRIAPLKLYFDDLKIFGTPNTIDAYYIEKIIHLSKSNKNKTLFLSENNLTKCWSAVNMIPFLMTNHSEVILETKPSGCQIGERPIDLYLEMLKNFGHVVNNNSKGISIKFKKCIHSSINCFLEYPSFTATSIFIYLCLISNVSYASLDNSSIEPEIIFLIETLQEFGFNISINYEERKIEFYKTKRITTIKSVSIPPDRNVIVTEMIDCLTSYNSYKFNPSSMINPLLGVLDKLGFDINSNIVSPNPVNDKGEIVEAKCGFYPKICSDWQPLLVALCLNYKLRIDIHDEVFENRYQLIKHISSVNNNVLYNIDSNNNLKIRYKNVNTIFSQEMKTFDCLNIRDGAAQLILSKNGTITTFTNIIQIFRGYEHIDQISPNVASQGRFLFE